MSSPLKEVGWSSQITLKTKDSFVVKISVNYPVSMKMKDI